MHARISISRQLPLSVQRATVLFRMDYRTNAQRPNLAKPPGLVNLVPGLLGVVPVSLWSMQPRSRGHSSSPRTWGTRLESVVNSVK